MSFAGGTAATVGVEIRADEQREVLDLAKKLNTSSLTIVEGDGVDHGLVWEALGDLGTTPPAEVDGKPIRGYLPEGDGELVLRRFIDDSVNILSETEMNLRRADEGLPTLNLLWPWGHGIRLPVPNLALRRGDPALVISSSLRQAGLARLAGYRHTGLREFGRGINTRLREIADRCLGEPASVVVLEAFKNLREVGRLDECAWLARELDGQLLRPVIDHSFINPTQVTILAPSAQTGLGLTLSTPHTAVTRNPYPFDERSLDERLLPSRTLWEAVDAAL